MSPTLTPAEASTISWLLGSLLDREPMATMLTLQAQLGDEGADQLLAKLELGLELEPLAV